MFTGMKDFFMIYPICSSLGEEQMAGNSNAQIAKFMRPRGANKFDAIPCDSFFDSEPWPSSYLKINKYLGGIL